MSTSGVVGLLLAAVLCSGYGLTPCVETFDEFEKAVLNNSDNVQALVRAFYQPNLPTPLSVRVVYHVQSMPPALTGSALSNVIIESQRTDIISTDRSCPPGNEIWLWVSSPVFIFVEPTKLNLCAMYTLNFFLNFLWQWTPPDAHVYVPIICNTANTFNFLNDLTSKVQVYAAAHLKVNDANQGFVLKGCGHDILTTLLPTTQKDDAKSMQILSEVSICIYLACNFCVIFGVLLVICILLQKYGDILTRTNQIPSFDNYSLFWGCVALSVVVNGLLTAHTVYTAKQYMLSRVPALVVKGGVGASQLLIVVIVSLSVSFYFGCKKVAFDIPSIYLWLLAPLFCFCMKKTRKRVVQWLALWSCIQCALHFFCYIPFLVLALLASPPTVFFTLLTYISTAVCLGQFLAAIFALCKRVKRDRGCSGCCRIVLDMFQVLGYVLLCLAFQGFSILISAAGVYANYGTMSWSSNLSIISIVFPSMVLAAITWGLRKIGTLWLQHRTEMNVSTKVDSSTPLLVTAQM